MWSLGDIMVNAACFYQVASLANSCWIWWCAVNLLATKSYTWINQILCQYVISICKSQREFIIFVLSGTCIHNIYCITVEERARKTAES